jgi:hypothetical protein
MRRDLAGVITSLDNGNPPWGPDNEPGADLSSLGALTSAQYYPAPAASPYHHLLLAILEDAIHCFQRNFAVKDGPRRALFRETEEWLFDSDGTAFLSCPMVCETLGINSAQLRRYLREWHLRMKAGLQAPRFVRCRSVPADPHLTSPDVYLTPRASDDSSSTSRSVEGVSGVSRNVGLGHASNLK